MAQKSGTTKRTNTSRSGRGTSAASSKRAPAKNSQKRAQPQKNEPEETIFQVLWSYSFGKALYLLLGIAVLIGLDFLISMNNYDKFFVTLGIELIAAMVIGWIVYLFVERRKLMQSEEPESDSDES